MGTFKNKEDYLKGLCVAHPLVQHNAVEVVDSVSRTRNGFFRNNNYEEILAATLQTVTYPCVGYIELDGKIKDVEDAMVDIRHTFKNGWLFLSHVDRFNNAEAEGFTDRIQAAYDEAFTVMEDFIRYMKDDWETNQGCGFFKWIDLNKINYVMVGPVIENEYGWILYFEDDWPGMNILSGDTVDPCNCTNDAEIIYINNESTKSFTWTDDRKRRFATFPIVEAWVQDTDGNYYLWAIEPVIDAPPPDFTMMSFDFGGNVTGFIVIK